MDTRYFALQRLIHEPMLLHGWYSCEHFASNRNGVESAAPAYRVQNELYDEFLPGVLRTRDILYLYLRRVEAFRKLFVDVPLSLIHVVRRWG